jgi:hypothetical protein
MVDMVGTRRPFRTYCEVRAYIAPGKLGAATPTASHPLPSWAPDEIECWHPREAPGFVQDVIKLRRNLAVRAGFRFESTNK